MPLPASETQNALGHAKGQVPALCPQQVMASVRERINAVISQPRRPAPDQYIAMSQRQSPGRVWRVNPPEGAGQAQRNPSDGCSKVHLIFITVLYELGAGPVAVDQASIGHKPA